MREQVLIDWILSLCSGGVYELTLSPAKGLGMFEEAPTLPRTVGSSHAAVYPYSEADLTPGDPVNSKDTYNRVSGVIRLYEDSGVKVYFTILRTSPEEGYKVTKILYAVDC